MGISEFQSFVESNIPNALSKVDLLEVARNNPAKPGYPYRGRPYKLRLVIDAESCLDRLYGGYYTDWICGGQWNRMLDYLGNLNAICRDHGVLLVVYFDGTLDPRQSYEWIGKQVSSHKKVSSIYKHITNKSTPPPKVWWSPPTGIETSLKSALRQLGIRIAMSVDDHQLEVMNFVREHEFLGLIAHSATYAMFDPPRYFSSESLKLTYRGSLETKEFLMDEVARAIDLNPERFNVLAALLGNHILTSEDLESFHKRISEGHSSESGGDEKQGQGQEWISSVITFVRNQASLEDIDHIASLIFPDGTTNKEEKVQCFKDSVNYYHKGTAAGFVKRGKKKVMRKDSGKKHSAGGDGADDVETEKAEIEASEEHLKHESGYLEDDAEVNEAGDAVNENSTGHNGTVEDSESDNVERDTTEISKGKAPGAFKSSEGTSSTPVVPSEILRITLDRHSKGMMSPWVFHVLKKGEIRIPVSMENEQDKELPMSSELYQPLRANAYAVLFSIKPYRKKKNGEEPPPQPEVFIKETSVSKASQGSVKCNTELVKAVPLDWLTPSLKRLWLGQHVEDRNRRLRAFLSCMNSDSPLMLNTVFVPQPLLLACCVLRYMLQNKQPRVLRKHELDAFLSMMASPHLHDPHFSQDIQLPLVSPRAVQLASLFMRGLEHAVFVNDVCGAPIPWHMCSSWLCMNGKLLHMKLLKSSKANMTPPELCDGQMNQLMLVDSMRQAILEGLNFEFAKVPMPMQMPGFQAGPGPRPNMRPPGPAFHNNYGGNFNAPPGGNFNRPPMSMSRGRGRGRGGMMGRGSSGGQLEIAGQVVGSWGPNQPQPSPQQHDQYDMSAFPPSRSYRDSSGPPSNTGASRSPVVSMKPAIRGKPAYRGVPNPTMQTSRGAAATASRPTTYAPRPSPRQPAYDAMMSRTMGRNLTVDPIDTRGLSPPMAMGNTAAPTVASIAGGAGALSVPHVSYAGLTAPSSSYASAMSPQTLENAVAQIAATHLFDPSTGLQHSMLHMDSSAMQMPSGFLFSGTSGAGLGTTPGTSLQNMHGNS